jgi:VWFA-related protein
VRYRAHVAFSTAFDIMKNLEKVQNRRKAFVYVSNGYDFDPFPAARYGDGPFYGQGFGGNTLGRTADPLTRQGQQFADADLARELADLTRAANRANATIYSIDPRGLVGGPDLDEEIDPVEWSTYIRKSQDSLRVLAEETGGTAIVNQNDFDKALKRIDAETSDYYVLGYYSTNPDPSKRVRNIEVKVNRPDVTVKARREYSLKTPGIPPPPPPPTLKKK